MNNQWAFEYHGDIQSILVFLAILAACIVATTHVFRYFVTLQVNREFEQKLEPFKQRADEFRRAAENEEDPNERMRLRGKAAEYERIIARLRQVK